MTVVQRFEEEFRRQLTVTLNNTDKEIVKGNVTCEACDFEKVRRADNIYELVDEAVMHAKKNQVGPAMFNHPVGFNIDLTPLPEIDGQKQDIEIR